ncbi:MAG TPA: universal stress protein [Solirubrobacteraceae bacterium]|nr:universal stress protein [Solirubrobacteraceae bacterium]
MRVLVWLVEGSWEATIDGAAALVPEGAEVTLLYVVTGAAEEVVQGARAGLLGRHPPPPPDEPALGSISEEAAGELLGDARSRWGGAAEVAIRHGRIEREVVAAAGDADLLVLARRGEHRHPGPKSLGHATRFVLDHAPCAVLLVWP